MLARTASLAVGLAISFFVAEVSSLPPQGTDSATITSVLGKLRFAAYTANTHTQRPVAGQRRYGSGYASGYSSGSAYSSGSTYTSGTPTPAPTTANSIVISTTATFSGLTAANFADQSFKTVYIKTLATGISKLLAPSAPVAVSAITTTVASRRKVTVTDNVNLGNRENVAVILTSSNKLSNYYTKNFAADLTTAVAAAGLQGITVGTVSGVTVTQTTGGAVNTTTSSSSSGLAGWAIALIIIACILCVALTGGVFYYVTSNPKHEPSNVTIHKDQSTHAETLQPADSAVTGAPTMGDIVEDRVPPAL